MRAERDHILHGFWVTSLGTLASRVLGLLRDVATAGLLGLAAGGVADAFVLALRIPNLLRRLLGEGALATAYLPVLSAELERDRQAAARLVTAVLICLAAVLALVLLLGEAVCAAVYFAAHDNDTRLLAGLTATLLPYLWFICLAAQLGTTLHALGRFRAAAWAANLLNVCWLGGAWWLAPWLTDDAVLQAYVLAGCVLLSGALQLGLLAVAVARAGLRPVFDLVESRAAGVRLLKNLVPVALVLSVTQLNTLVDSAVAWLLTAPTNDASTIAWLPGGLAYPLAPGATAALYYAERFYQLPVGLIGVAMATVIFPRLGRQAARGDRLALGADLAQGLRLAAFATLPCSVGLMLLARPLAEAVFAHGAFSADDAARTAASLAAYASGVWAYCTAAVALRGFYAIGDARRPLAIGVVALAINGLLDFALVWPLREAGLALATAVAAMVQATLLIVVFARVHAPFAGAPLARCAAKTVLATAAMAAVVWSLGLSMQVPTSLTLQAGALQAGTLQAGTLALRVAAGAITFVAIARALGSAELAVFCPWLFRSQDQNCWPATLPAGHRSAVGKPRRFARAAGRLHH